ncbi:MAG: isoleucine--tRNA ligase [Candidatus Brocadiia bacterium]
MEYKHTLNLPKTDFAMKANLTSREPIMQARWAEMDVYSQIRTSRKGRPVFTMHDGPPYANGGVHIGTGMNKILKDIVVKYFTLRGFDVPYIPGWDCHGLPIEHKVVNEIKANKEELTPAEVRQRCRAYAQKYIDLQRQQFMALGVFGDWYHPYLTFTPEYESGVLDVFRRMYEKGYVTRALKPIHWCMHCETALAEAEIEYGDETGPSIFVLFPDAKGLDEAFGLKLDAPAYAFIWTTTPWTLPSNLAVAVNPALEYALVSIETKSLGRGFTFVAKDRIEAVRSATRFERFEVVAVCSGSALAGVTYRHPFADRTGKLILADFVTVEDGTGIVHVAPGHGQEDYFAGLQNGLDVLSPVDSRGRFTKEVPLWEGLSVHDADPKIIAHLNSQGFLVGSGILTHSYPHCWRCKNPVIFRATPQWFVKIEHEGLRDRMLSEIDATRWVPSWGYDRISGMVKGRPDWCISRQRVWGVLIPAFYCLDCGETVLDGKILDSVVEFVKKHGADGYFDCAPGDVLPKGTCCPKCSSSRIQKEHDIFDVWFESGSSFRSVVMARPELSFPADVYLEGTDQHRGWFQLSLLPAVAAYDTRPFKTVVTHGFIVDEWGQKLSKSKKKESKYDVTAAHDCVRVFGADVVRLWICSVDYKEDVLFSEEVVSRLNGSYFAIRNCFRYMLGNLSGFSQNEMVEYEQLGDLDKWALAELAALEEKLRGHFEDFEYHRFYQDFKNFCDVTLSSDYFDILKDRLYCDASSWVSRRSSRTVLFHICSALARMMAPVLVHTAEEIWDALKVFVPLENSVHMSLWPEIPKEWRNEKARSVFAKIGQVRYAVRRRLEILRNSGALSRSEEAGVAIWTTDSALHDLLLRNASALPEVFKVSELSICSEEREGQLPDPDLPSVSVSVWKVEHRKCARCWNHRADVGHNADHPDICSRCVSAVKDSDCQK